MIKNNNTIATLIEELKTANDKERIVIINKLSKDYNNALPMLWAKVLEEDNLRIIFSVIRDILKKEKPRGMFKRTIGNSKGKLAAFLKHSDPKVRKNICGVIGALEDSAYLDSLYDAYYSEDKLFVKASYVLAIGNCGGDSDAEKLKEILEEMIKKEKECEESGSPVMNNKHINEEKLALTRTIDKLSPPIPHEFTGFKKPVSMMLTAMNHQYHLALEDLKEKSIRGQLVTEGIIIKEKDLDKVYQCRTFYELLFPLDDCKNLEFDYNKIAEAIIDANIVKFLNQCHTNELDTPFNYRIEFKTEEYSRERSEFVKNLSIELDKLSFGSLKNSTSSYEVEIRVVENNNRCSVLLKLYSYKDNRFDYRKNSLATSINPVTAAIVMKSIEKWLKPTSMVIDPFCGTGTMLIERAKLKGFDVLTGVDIYKKAIEAAAINSTIADVDIELVDEDIFEYYSFETFDELITNMPFDNKTVDHSKYADLYRNFVHKISRLVKQKGRAFVYTVEAQLFKKYLLDNDDLELLEDIKFETGNLTPHMFVLKVK